MSESKTPRFDELLAHAERCIKDKRVYARYADGTPLSNDIPVWMATFAQEYIRDAESDLAAALSERDALAARVEKAEADARRWRFVRGKVSRILNERTLKMDGLRVEVYYDEPQAFLIVPTDNGALFDEAIDAGMSREEKS